MHKFKMSLDEMIDFNDKCESVCSLGPGSLSQYEDRDILRGEVKPKELVKFWKSNLWLKNNLKSVMKCANAIRLGIANDADDVMDVFLKYKAYKALKILAKLEKKNALFTIKFI